MILPLAARLRRRQAPVAASPTSTTSRPLARLFERFLFRFYDREQTEFTVDAPHLEWSATGSAEALEYLPRMRTDIVLSGPGRTVAMDAKYYGQTLSEYFYKASIQSEHLYQIFAYVRHLAVAGRRVEGVLLYPRTTQSVLVDVTLFEHPVRVATINLAQAWPGIHQDLIRVLG